LPGTLAIALPGFGAAAFILTLQREYDRHIQRCDSMISALQYLQDESSHQLSFREC
jgi:hypothetical protein